MFPAGSSRTRFGGQFKGVEHVIRAGDGKGSPVWIDRDGARPTIRVGGRPEHAARRFWTG